LIIQPPGVDVKKLRPKVVLHVHLSEESLLGYQDGRTRFGGGVGRFEGVGGPFARQLWRAATPAKQRAPAEPG